MAKQTYLLAITPFCVTLTYTDKLLKFPFRGSLKTTDRWKFFRKENVNSDDENNEIKFAVINKNIAFIAVFVHKSLT